MLATVSLTSFSFSFVDLIRALPPLPPVLLVFLHPFRDAVFAAVFYIYVLGFAP